MVTARLPVNLRCIDSTECPYTPGDGHSFHFQRLCADDSVLQKRNAREQDGHDFKRQRGDSSVQRHRDDFQRDDQATSGDVTTAATNTGMPTINDDPDTCSAARNIHTAHHIITVINDHINMSITLEFHPQSPTTTIPPLFLTPAL